MLTKKQQESTYNSENFLFSSNNEVRIITYLSVNFLKLFFIRKREFKIKLEKKFLKNVITTLNPAYFLNDVIQWNSPCIIE